jgi:putative peptidoglycan lipid II flippase
VPLRIRTAAEREADEWSPVEDAEPASSEPREDPYPFAEPPPGLSDGPDPFPHARTTAGTPPPAPAARAPEHVHQDPAEAPTLFIPAPAPLDLGAPEPAVDEQARPGEDLPGPLRQPSSYPGAASDFDDIAAEPAAVQGTERRILRNTAIFSIATGASRVAGLVREVVAASYFGTSGAASAFTLAFQVPNLVRGLVADAALSAAFVPVFTDLLEKGKRREAAQLASTLLFYIVAGLGAITAFFILAAGVVMPLFIGQELVPWTDLVVGLSQVLFPIVLILGVNGLVVGILNAYDHFTIPAIAPLVWNMVIIALLIVLKPEFKGDNQLYAYAIGVLVATVVQLGMSVPMLRRVGFRFSHKLNLRDPRIKQVFILMLPVTIALGIINFDLLLNSTLGTLVSESAPRAIDSAFRVYMLPQGMFSVAVATVLFPALARLASRKDFDGLRAMLATGTRQIFFLLIPAAAFCIVLATPIVRLIFQRGEFTAASTEEVSTALFWFSFSLPFAGVNLLLTRAFFSVQRPWYPTALAGLSLVVNGIVSLLLYKPFGIAGIVIGTAVASAVMTVQQFVGLRRLLGGKLDMARTLTAVIRITIASAALGGASYLVWDLLSSALGESLAAQIVSVGGAALIGLGAYVIAARLLRIQEIQQIEGIIRSRTGRTKPTTTAGDE